MLCNIKLSGQQVDIVVDTLNNKQRSIYMKLLSNMQGADRLI